jgi:hypothetical protein
VGKISEPPPAAATVATAQRLFVVARASASAPAADDRALHGRGGEVMKIKKNKQYLGTLLG